MTANKWADTTPSVPFGGLHGSGNDKTQFERIVELERELAAAKEELAQERERADKAEELAKRSTARLVEMSDPGFIGAFAARDHWKERAERAEARAEVYKRDAERYRLIVKECLILDNDCTQMCYSVKNGITGEFVYTPGGDIRWGSYDDAIDAAIDAAKGER